VIDKHGIKEDHCNTWDDTTTLCYRVLKVHGDIPQNIAHMQSLSSKTIMGMDSCSRRGIYKVEG